MWTEKLLNVVMDHGCKRTSVGLAHARPTTLDRAIFNWSQFQTEG